MKPCYLFRGASCLRSPPMRGRGLKRARLAKEWEVREVAPHAGAWIETSAPIEVAIGDEGRPPCGGVD